jgi:hypothetical protein
MKMKSTPPSPQHAAMRDELIAVIRKYGAHLRADEILALAAYTVGQIIALQDQRTMSPAMAMEIVAANIEAGNQHAMSEVASAGGPAN